MFYIESSSGKRIDIPGQRCLKYWKLRTPEAVSRRRKYKADKPKKSRIQCHQCFKRFTPKRSTKRFCSDACRKKHNRDEWKVFERFGFIDEWNQLPLETRQRSSQLQFLRGERYKKLMGLRP